jgi:hypothetical protein
MLGSRLDFKVLQNWIKFLLSTSRISVPLSYTVLGTETVTPSAVAVPGRVGFL